MSVLIRDVRIVDGSGAASFVGHILVSDGVIAELGPGVSSDGSSEIDRIIDGAGLVASPGFIDMHAHSDLIVATERDHRGKLAQGCTTEVLGQDGLSYVPSNDETAPQLQELLTAWNGPVKADTEASRWRSVADYLDTVDKCAPTNVAYLLPHGTVRLLAMGWDNRRPTPAELTRMQDIIAEGMRQGAVGLSAGLSYTPGMYADTDELVALCETVAQHGGFFAPHQRSYGAGAVEGYAEMIDIAQRSGVALHLAHATMNFQVNEGRAAELLDMIDAARAEGIDISIDTYPYLPGMTMLAALLPSWVAEGGKDAQVQRLQEPSVRERIIHELDVVGTDGAHGVPVEWEGIEISGVTAEHLQELTGLSIAQAAAKAGLGPAEFYLDLLLEDDFRPTCLMHVGHEDNVRIIMIHDTHTAGSDGLMHGTSIHPRAWGTFARYLGHYCREEKLLTLEECVHHMTGRPAKRLGLTDRGLLREGFAADIVLFDPHTVAAQSTFKQPRQTPTGIPYVFIGGSLAIDNGLRTDICAGKALRSEHLGKPQSPSSPRFDRMSDVPHY